MIDVHIVEDHPIVREGLRMLLSSSREFRVSAIARTRDEALQTAQASPPNVVLLDLHLGPDDASAIIPALSTLRTDAGPTRVLVVTAERDPNRHRVLRQLGAQGVLTKDATPDELLDGIRRVHRGERWFPTLASREALTPPLTPAVDRAIPSLTDREKELVALIAEGCRNAAIAKRLGISEKTVRNHLSVVFDKLHVSDRLSLLVEAYRLGLAVPPSAPNNGGQA